MNHDVFIDNACKSETERKAKEEAERRRIIDMFEMVCVEGGTFTMGASASDSEAMYSEKQAYIVTLPGYYIGKYEVTQKQWMAVMGSNPSEFKGDNLPVECVSWDEVQEFIRNLNERTGRNYRLPTEAEWEFAAKGGNKSHGYKYSGSNNIDDIAWYGDNSNRQTHPVGSKSPNELGIYDMTGNVWEWCQNWKGDYSSFIQTYPKGPLSNATRVLRGGCWCDYAWYCRASFRLLSVYGSRGSSVGFRLALSLEGGEAETDQRRLAEEQRRKEEEARRQQAALNIEMVYVAGGTFTMGASASDSEASDIEKPAHRVTLSGYYIGKYEVTQKQWMAVMGYNLSEFKGDNLPVERVNWDEIQEFIRKLNERTGKNYRLPTEAEWEFAAKGGNNSHGYKYSGSNNIDDVAWYRDNSNMQTHPVGSKSPNELGIYDMTGNVREWCQDWYDKDYYGNSPSSDPEGPPYGAERVLRGGSWFNSAGSCRVSYRDYYGPDYRRGNLGFRVVLIP